MWECAQHSHNAFQPISELTKPNLIRLRECGSLECKGEIDEANPVVPGVKILGEESRNKRRYLPESVSPAQYDRLPINLNHPDGPKGQRRVQDRFGWFENAVKDGADWRGDLRYNPRHPFAPQFAWLVKNNPSLVGMSHDAIGTGRNENGVFIVEKVTEIKSVDIVADPATTKGLFESMDPELSGGAGGDEKLDDLESHIKNAVAAICGDGKLDLSAKMKKIKAALKILEQPEDEEVEEDDESEESEGSGEKDDDDEEKKTDESLKQLALKEPGVKKLLEQLDAAQVKLAVREKNELAHRLCVEAKLLPAAISETFLGQLIDAKDEVAMKKLIEDRKAVASIQRPKSSGPIRESAAAKIDNAEFAKTLKGR